MARFGGKLNMRNTQGPHPTVKVRKPQEIIHSKTDPRPHTFGIAGRPKKQIDYEVVARLAKIQCTISEIAAVVGCHPETLSRNPKFVETYNNAKEGGKMSLRRKQYQSALKHGNTAMLIFLGKQYLGQKDVAASEISGPDGGPIPIAAMMAAVDANLTRDEQNQLILLLKKAKVESNEPKRLG